MDDAAAANELSRLALTRPDLLETRAFIDGAWVDGEQRIIVRNPAKGRDIASVPSFGRKETLNAVAAAHAALPGWRAHSAKERSAILRRWFDLVTDHLEDLARLMTAEQGKPLAEARAEIAYAGAFVQWFAEEAKRAYGDIIPGHTRNARIWVDRRPVGVVAAITPWNFPAAMITRKVAPALAAGCTIVLKPSELTPFTALALAKLSAEAGVPPGVFSVITGAPQEIGDVFVTDPRISKFTFTGSTPVGKMLAARCMNTVKRVSLELGGNAPFIVAADANIDAAIAGALASKFRNTGQTCVCANRFLVHEAVYDAFAHGLAERARALRVGDGLAGDTDQGPLINIAAHAKVTAHVADALAGGAEALTGGKSHAAGDIYFEPTVLTGVRSDALLCQEETFGPIAGLVRVDSDDQAISLANASRAGLAAYVYAGDFSRAHRFAEALDFGMVGLNTGLISTEVAPFGGCKESGIGREGSHYGLAEFHELKTVCADIGEP